VWYGLVASRGLTAICLLPILPMRRLVIPAMLLLATLPGFADAQVIPAADSGASRPDMSIPRPANESLFRRARRLVSEGNGVAGRALVDSLLAAADPATAGYGDALYWHGVLAPTAADAEGDYRRVIVEYPLAFYSGDALLAIAELEQARGDRVAAMQHLQRFVREHPANPGRGIAALGVARLAFEERDSTLACTMLAEARTSVATTDVELRNQIDYYSGRCATVATSMKTGSATTSAATTVAPVSRPPLPPVVTQVAEKAPARPAVATAPAPARKSITPIRAPTPTRAPAPTHAAMPRTTTSYTIQVAAYNTRPDAERLVARLATRDIKARVSGTSMPFRVRLALYRTRKEAANEVVALKRRGIVGFVAEETRPVGATSP